jgi:hypothetical protein
MMAADGKQSGQIEVVLSPPHLVCVLSYLLSMHSSLCSTRQAAWVRDGLRKRPNSDHMRTGKSLPHLGRPELRWDA